MGSESENYLRIGEVAKISGLSHRALRYYEQIGIIVPSERSLKGYRLYSRKNLEDLSHLIVAKSLGFEPKAIARQLQDDDFDWELELEAQEQKILQQIQSCELTLSALRRKRQELQKKGKSMKIDMTNEELFWGLDPTELEGEAQERWGATEAFAESQRRVRSYSEADWKRYKQEQEEWLDSLSRCLRRGCEVKADEVQSLVAEHRQSFDRWFYPCDQAMQKQLADLYESDSRFADYYERHTPGLSRFLIDAIRAAD